MSVESPNGPPNVYVVDDAADYRYLVEEVFTLYLPQFAVSLFDGGHELLNQLRTNPERPGLILLDLHMPDLSGAQTLQHLKQQPDLKQIPVVVVTSSSSAQEVQACYEAGANACLAKPLGLEAMRQQLQQVCQYWLLTNQFTPTG